MTRKKILLLIFFFSFLSLTTLSQSLPTYNHYYIHPYFYNPATLAAKNYTEVNLIHRQQWAGFDGAPAFTQLSLALPFTNKVATGLNLYNNKSGMLTTTSIQASFCYTIDFSNDTYFSFGLSGGAARNAIDVSKIDDLSDPALRGKLDKSFFFEGQAGVNFQFKKLNIGFSIPQLFKRSLLSATDLQDTKFDAFETLVSSISYRLEASPDITFEPLLLYRQDEVNGGKLGGYATLYLKQLLWVGGGYKQDYGLSAYAGFQISERIQLGYSYEFATISIPEITNKTHEFRIAVQLGKRKVNRQELARSKKRKEAAIADDTENQSVEEKSETAIDSVEESIVKDEIEAQNIPQNDMEKEVKQNTPIAKTESPVSVEAPLPEVNEPAPITINVPSKKITKELPTEQSIVKEEMPAVPVERVVKAVTSSHVNELKKGVYVIVGVFGVTANAKKYIAQLRQAGYEASLGYNSGTRLNYVYIHGGESLAAARVQRDGLRGIDKFQFHDAWIMTIEE